MTTDQNNAFVKQMLNEVMNGYKLSLIDQLIAPNFQHHGIPDAKGGPAGFRETLQGFLTAFPDFHINMEHVAADGDLIATRGYWTGTNTGSFMGIPATGKKVRVDYIDFWKLQNGKAIENWVSMDMQAMMTQLGVMPAAATA